jgi:2-keto-3-deoxy-L-rhamnonate aldolase RhmA
MKRALAEGQVVLGTMATSSSPGLVEAAPRAGTDFVFIDAEHVALDRAAGRLCRRPPRRVDR